MINRKILDIREPKKVSTFKSETLLEYDRFSSIQQHRKNLSETEFNKIDQKYWRTTFDLFR